MTVDEARRLQQGDHLWWSETGEEGEVIAVNRLSFTVRWEDGEETVYRKFKEPDRLDFLELAPPPRPATEVIEELKAASVAAMGGHDTRHALGLIHEILAGFEDRLKRLEAPA